MKEISLTVNVVTTHTDCSLILVTGAPQGVRVKDLPRRLADKMVSLCSVLGPGVTGIDYAETGQGERALLIREGRTCVLPESVLQPNARRYLEDSIDLLVWYFREHFHSTNPGAFGALMVCNDCGRGQENPFDPNKCQNFECLSHHRKAEIDLAYVPTTEEGDPVAKRFCNLRDEIAVKIGAHTIH